MRILFAAYELGRVGNLGGGCCKCAALVCFYRPITPMVVMIAVVVDAVPQLQLRAVGAGPDACRSLLIAITNATVLDGGRKLDMRWRKFPLTINGLLTDAVDVTMLGKGH